MIVALAGRRIDAPQSPKPVFPAENISLVRDRLRYLFETQPVTALIASAACGADLLALDEARSIGIRCRLVLPFDTQRFRETSVVDRPGDWGRIYDGIIAEASRGGDLLVLAGELDENDAYAAASEAILQEAAALAGQSRDNVLAVVVWNRASHGDSDLTEAFRVEALKRGYPVSEISTVAAVSQTDNPECREG